jgi:FkbM family methyltransferase
MLSRWRDRWRVFRSMTAFSNPVGLILTKLISQQNVVVYQLGAFRLVSFEACGDGTSIRECLQERAYDRALDAVRATGRARTYINVGANVGAFDVAVHSSWGSDTKGIAVELNPWTCARLRSNLRINNLDTMAINAGIAARSGITELNIKRSGPSQSLYQSKGAASDRVEVRVMPMRDIPSPLEGEPVDLLKVDCEGAEYEIFEHVAEPDLRRFRFAVVEIHTTTRSTADADELILKICNAGAYRSSEIGRAADARLVLFSPIT